MLSSGVRPPAFSTAVRSLQRRSGGGVRDFQEIPNTGSNGWINLLRFWKDGRFSLLHKHMENTFRRLGPIYRESLGSQSSVNIMLPMDIGELFRSEGLHPRRMTLQPWATHRETRRHSKGVFLKNGTEWRSDRLLLNKEVMVASAVRRFLPLLDDVARDFCHSLRQRVETEGVGERDQRSMTLDPSPDLFRFALEASCHVLYGERIGLFSSSPSEEAERFIWARGYQRLQTAVGGASDGRFQGVLGQLMEAGQLSSELIKANITELMAGGVDTTAVPLQFALFELARNPDVQERVRAQVLSSWEQASGDPQKALQGAPLLKGVVKETLSPEVFECPERFEPSRWAASGEGFRSLAFGFGSRQCVGRRIAENEMQLLLLHLRNFRLTVSSTEELNTKYTLILLPESPPRITFTTRSL
ncbi:hypothetical protein cypCar_00038981 [Cyprinus carpio]|nr:hypothetical protein cypCar_00038981 [Cyprinus carpio]